MTAAPTQAREPASNASENTPLLRDEANGSNGSNGSAEAGAPAEEPPHEGMPEVLARMHILLPAIGIGVSRFSSLPQLFCLWSAEGGGPVADDCTQIYMCAMDQMLTVASYAKIGSDLNALNSTSWIATA